jgi:NAD(P)-dependent dehydrogenase (short-subunit alcohol dehydrogenase family)
MATDSRRTILIVGISRGLGRGLAAEYLRRGWLVIGTVRAPSADPTLQKLADGTSGLLRIEQLDVTRANEIRALRERLVNDRLDVLLVNAGVSNGNVPVAAVDETTFNEVMNTNALAPLKVIEALQDLVPEQGTIAVMSSGQGSISRNNNGGFEVYRASKSALNQLMRSYAARHQGESRTLLLIAPGWVKTELGGPGARLTVQESVPGIVDTIDAQRATGELRFVDYQNQTVPW